MKSKINYLLWYGIFCCLICIACSGSSKYSAGDFADKWDTRCQVNFAPGYPCNFVDDDCYGKYKCADLTGGEYILDAFQERSLRNKCLQKRCGIASPPPPPPPITVPDYPDRSNFWVKIDSASGSNNRFGFDPWYSISNHSDNKHLLEGQKISYLSVGDGDSTYIMVYVNIQTEHYDFFEIRIANKSGKASFSKVNFSDTSRVLRNSGGGEFKIFGISSGTAELEVLARNNDMPDEVCLVGDRDAAYERLQIKVFREHTFGRFNVYRANGANSQFRPTTDEWKSYFNSVLKQMVARLHPFWTEVKDAAPGWDDNDNGVLDVIFDKDFNMMDSISINQFNQRYNYGGKPWNSEHYLLARSNSELTASVNNASHAHFIVRDTIRLHHVLRNNFLNEEGDYILDLNTVENIVSGGQYRISKFYDKSDKGELIRILGVDTNINSIKFERWDEKSSKAPLDNAYYINNNITIHHVGVLYNGFSVRSCSFASDRQNYNVHVHEFLHHDKDARYFHVDTIQRPPYSDNLMFPFTPPSGQLGSRLNARKLKTHGGGEHSQWDLIPGR
jgi:hypothetical protein